VEDSAPFARRMDDLVGSPLLLMRFNLRFFLSALWLVLAATAVAGEFKTLLNQARASHAKREYSAALETFKTAFLLPQAIEQASSRTMYDAACAAASTGDSSLAFEWLQLAAGKGYDNVTHLTTDEDLKSLHASEDWNQVVAHVRKNLETKEAGYDKALQTELLAILEADQRYRKQLAEVTKLHGRDSQQMKDLWKTIAENDAENLPKVEAILEKHGWVGPETVGPKANSALFLVIQHAPIATQQKHLPLMREAVKNKKAPGSSLALLEDRVALGEGRKQIYGSQIGQNSTTGEYFVLPLEDPEHVDERRAQVGLPPLADYLKNWKITWDVAAYKAQLPQIEAWQRGE
jgi:hypothetical protein